jgi:hypothetical protein
MLQTVSSKRGEHQGNDLTPSMIPRGEIKMGLLWKEATPEFVIHEGVEEIRTESGEAQNQGSQGEMRTLAPPKRRCFKRQGASRLAPCLPLCSTVLEVWFWSYSQGETARFVPPIARYARIRGKLALRFRQGVLRLGASNVAMSYAMALFCKTHRYIRSASFPPGAAGGQNTPFHLR